MELSWVFLNDTIQRSLNPYYNGRYSWRSKTLNTSSIMSVLILIIMEDTHGEGFANAVDGKVSLNPYYNGRYSWSMPIFPITKIL